jgi:hypothetical protein
MRITMALATAGLLSTCMGTSIVAPVAFDTALPPGSQTCGKVHQGNGDATLIADATKAGTVGCTEAFDVFAEYQKEAPTKAQGTLRQLALPNGWSCAVVDNSGINCGNAARGLQFHTQQ